MFTYVIHKNLLLLKEGVPMLNMVWNPREGIYTHQWTLAAGKNWSEAGPTWAEAGPTWNDEQPWMALCPVSLRMRNEENLLRHCMACSAPG